MGILAEKLFGGNFHYGLDDDAVMRNLTEIFCRGVASRRKLAEIKKTKSKLKQKV